MHYLFLTLFTLLLIVIFKNHLKIKRIAINSIVTYATDIFIVNIFVGKTDFLVVHLNLNIIKTKY